MAHPQVNSTVRRRDDSDSRRRSARGWRRPVDADQQLDRIWAGIWPIAAVSTAGWSAKVFGPALPSRSSIASYSAVLASHAASGWKP